MEQHPRHQLPQLIVDQRQYFFAGQRIAGFHLRRDASDVRHPVNRIHCADIEPARTESETPDSKVTQFFPQRLRNINLMRHMESTRSRDAVKPTTNAIFRKAEVIVCLSCDDSTPNPSGRVSLVSLVDSFSASVDASRMARSYPVSRWLETVYAKSLTCLRWA
jgi:hypothetical protein